MAREKDLTLKQTCCSLLDCSAICVQRFDDSLNSAIHITYRSSLRSSSMHEPRDPPLKVVNIFFLFFSPRLSSKEEKTKKKKK